MFSFHPCNFHLSQQSLVTKLPFIVLPSHFLPTPIRSECFASLKRPFSSSLQMPQLFQSHAPKAQQFILSSRCLWFIFALSPGIFDYLSLAELLKVSWTVDLSLIEVTLGSTAVLRSLDVFCHTYSVASLFANQVTSLQLWAKLGQWKAEKMIEKVSLSSTSL